MTQQAIRQRLGDKTGYLLFKFNFSGLASCPSVSHVSTFWKNAHKHQPLSITL